MRISGRKHIGGKISFGCLFLAGILLGIFAGGKILKGSGASEGLLDSENLYRIRYMTVEKESFFVYILGLRLKKVLFLALTATTYLGLAAAGAACVISGVTGGFFMYAALSRYGLRGILLVVAGLMPHCLIYLPAFYLLLIWCEQICRGIYFDKNILSAERGILLVKLLQILGIITLFIIGSVMECHLNPIFLKKVLNIF